MFAVSCANPGTEPNIGSSDSKLDSFKFTVKRQGQVCGRGGRVSSSASFQQESLISTHLRKARDINRSAVKRTANGSARISIRLNRRGRKGNFCPFWNSSESMTNE